MTAQEAAARAAAAARAGIDNEIYGGLAPHDSNALSEVWPTQAGCAFTLECGGHKLAVIVCGEQEPVPPRYVLPDWLARPAP